MDEGWINGPSHWGLEGELLAGDYAALRLIIPQVCGPDRGRQVVVGISGEELVIVGGDVVRRSGVLGSVKELLPERIVGGRRC